MPLAPALRRLALSCFGLLQTRAKLALVEAEEEALRYFTYLLLSLMAAFCVFMAFLLAVALIVAVFRDTHRIASLLGLILFFLLACAGLGWSVRTRYRRKPRLLEHTLAELQRDAQALTGSWRQG